MSDDATKPAKKKGFNFVLVLVPVALVAALALAFFLPPTHALIVNGPLKPLFAKIGMASPASKAGAKGTAPADPAADVKRLTAELDAAHRAQTDKDARIAQLQADLSKSNAGASPSPSPVPKPSPTAVPEQVKRVAAYWGGMEAEKAADIAKQLPSDYVRAVFSQMPADAVAEIMNALPAKTAATLTAAVADSP